MIRVVENWAYVPDEVYDYLAKEGYEEAGSVKGDFETFRKVVKTDGKLKGKWKAVPSDAKSIDDIIDITYDQALGYEPIINPRESSVSKLSRELGKMLLPPQGYTGRKNESKLTESDFTGDPLLPDVKDVYEELIRMYDVRKDVGYEETAKKMAEYVGGKANVSTSRTSLDNDYMEINWKVYGDFEFDGRKKTSYDGRNSILSDSYGNWLMYIEDLCMAFYKVNGGKGGYTPDLIKAIGKGY